LERFKETVPKDLEDRQGYLCYISNNNNWPSRKISIRDIEESHYTIVDSETKMVMEEVKESRAMFDVHPDAIYLHLGKTYVVTNLDIENKIAFVERKEVDYWTKHRDMTDINVKRALNSKSFNYIPVNSSNFNLPNSEVSSSASMLNSNSLLAHYGIVDVTTVVIGYRKIIPVTGQLLEVVDLKLPPYEYETKALWIDVPLESILKLTSQGLSKTEIEGGIHSISHCLCSLIPFFINSSIKDVTTDCRNEYDSRSRPHRIYVADTSKGGMGISEKCFEIISPLISAAFDSVNNCRCQDGCPSCIYSPECSENNIVTNKRAAQLIFKELLNLV